MNERAPDRELTYSEYINVPALLRAQRLPEEPPRGVQPEDWPKRPTKTNSDGTSEQWQEGAPWPREWPHEELLFIITHQTFELWFKMMLHDLDDVLSTACSVAEKNGSILGAVELAQREPEQVPPLRRSLERFPKTKHVLEHTLQSNEWERRWAQELHEPGFFPRYGAPERANVELRWFDDPTLSRWARRVDRATKILRHSTGAFDVLATMPPEEFLEFRSRLSPASGFGSTQFRELELSLGLKDAHRQKLASRGDLSFRRHMPDDEVQRIEERMRKPSLRDLVYALLNARDLRGSDANATQLADAVMARNLVLLHNDFAVARARWGEASDIENHLHSQWRTVDEHLTQFESVQLVQLYTTANARPALRDFLERCLELDDAVRVWRQTHIPIVERIIGARPGTGGGGLAYLHTTLRLTRAFPCLWESRSVLTR